MVDSATALPTSENYGIDATYGLIEIATGKQVMSGSTFSRVTHDIPDGQLKRFARTRAARDAENRASAEIVTTSIRASRRSSTAAADISAVIARSAATKQSSFWLSGLLRCARNDVGMSTLHAHALESGITWSPFAEKTSTSSLSRPDATR